MVLSLHLKNTAKHMATSEKQPIGLTPEQTSELLHNDPRAILVDIRATMEYLFVGHPVGAVHIPWIDEPDWVINPHFVTEVRKLILGGVLCVADEVFAPLLLICRSGKRPVVAGNALLESGFGYVPPV